MGEVREFPSRLSKELAEELLSLVPKDADHQTLIGKTMCTNDFYEGKLWRQLGNFLPGSYVIIMLKIY